MLSELLKAKIPDIVFYQLNTDGVTIGFHPKYDGEVTKCIEKWEKLTKLKMENNYYDKMVIRDVNNYMAISTKGKVKRKGLFGYSMNPEDKEMDYHKNPSMLVIPKALEAYFKDGVPYEEYIRNCTDIYDFCAGVKVTKDFNAVLYSYNKDTYRIDKEIIKQQVVRYYVSNFNTSIKKKYKPGSKIGMKAVKKSKKGNEPGVVEIQAKGSTTYFNVYKERGIKKYNIDYDFYIRAARDIVNQVSPHAYNLKLDFKEAA